MSEPPPELEPRGDLLELEVRGDRFTAWEEVEFTRSIDAISGSFRVIVSPTPRSVWPIRAGDDVKVIVGEEVLLNGFVDSFVGTSTKEGGRRITVSGRDRTADLVDCSATNEPNLWINQRLEQIVADIAKPFGVGVDAQRSGGERFLVFKLNPGESAWTSIDRAARLRSTLVFSDGRGDLVLALPGVGDPAAVDLVESAEGNVLRSVVTQRNQGRFSEYRVVGQKQGTDQGWGRSAAGVEGRALDSEITRFRPIVIVAEGQVDIEQAIARAEWEAITRAARGANLEVVVQGWREKPGGVLWAVNKLVYVNLTSWQIRKSLLIQAVKFTRTRAAGQLCTLSLVRSDAYTTAPDVALEIRPFDQLLEGDDFDE